MRATRRVTRAVKFIAKAAGEAAVLMVVVLALLFLQGHAKTVRHHAVRDDLEVAPASITTARQYQPGIPWVNAV